MLFVGLFLLGALTGLLLAWSSTPIVSVIAPLLFGLAAAATTIVISRADPESWITKARLRVIGKSLTGLCSGCIVALVCGIYIKDRVNSRHDIDLSAQTNAVRLVIIRAKLNAIGASPQEIRALIGKFDPKDEKNLDEAIKLMAGTKDAGFRLRDLFPGVASQPRVPAPFNGDNPTGPTEKRG